MTKLIHTPIRRPTKSESFLSRMKRYESLPWTETRMIRSKVARRLKFENLLTTPLKHPSTYMPILVRSIRHINSDKFSSPCAQKKLVF